MPGNDSAPDAQDRLDSWKEIAAYLRKGVRTIQRWEQTDGLPVRRLSADRTGPVFAYKSELDAWLDERSRTETPDSVQPIDAPGADIRWLASIVMLVVAITGGVAVWMARAGVPSKPAVRPVPLTADHGWELEPSISPDGREVAYVFQPADQTPFIYLKTVGSDSARRLTNGTAIERTPAWSPDGRLLAFVRVYPERSRRVLTLISPTAQRETEVAELTGKGGLVWSPDGKWIVTTEGTVTAVTVVAILVATGEKRRLTEAYSFPTCGFGVPPGSDRLIVCRGGPGPASVIEIGLTSDFRPNGTVRTLIASKWMKEMVLSRRGDEILFTEGPAEEQVSLWKQRLAENAVPELVAELPRVSLTPSSSADGRRIVLAVSGGFRESTWRVGLEEWAYPAPLLSSTHSDLNPDYSPDGRYIAFHSTRTGVSEIWIADRDGANAHRLTETNARTTATPRWSPDGRWIAYESNESGQSEIYLVRSSGGVPQRLTNDKSTDAIPSWSHDGKLIYFCSDRTGRFEIWSMPAMGGAPRQVTRDGGFVARESPDGKYLYYTQTRNAGPLWRLTLSDGVREKVSSEARGLFFAPVNGGVYFHDNKAILRWDAGSQAVKTVLTPPKTPGLGLAVSPDEKELLFTQMDAQETDLYLIAAR